MGSEMCIRDRWEDDPAPFDNRFYWAAGLPRDLDDLKSQYKAQTKVTAASLLAPTDWRVVKAAEVSSYTVPSATLTHRAAIRTASNTIEAAIDGAADLDAFIALFDAPEDGNAPINDWPEEV